MWASASDSKTWMCKACSKRTHHSTIPFPPPLQLQLARPRRCWNRAASHLTFAAQWRMAPVEGPTTGPGPEPAAAGAAWEADEYLQSTSKVLSAKYAAYMHKAHKAVSNTMQEQMFAGLRKVSDEHMTSHLSFRQQAQNDSSPHATSLRTGADIPSHHRQQANM